MQRRAQRLAVTARHRTVPGMAQNNSRNETAIEGRTPGSSAWHSRASGDLTTWATGYQPRSRAASEVWAQHHAAITPWIDATRPAGVTEARRVTSAVLELLAWALPEIGDLEECMTEEVLQRFRLANPTGLGDGSLENVGGRIRRVLRARIAPQHEARPRPSTSDRRATTSDSNKPYDEDQWLRLVASVRDDAHLGRVLEAPWVRPEKAAWNELKTVAANAGIALRQSRVQLTINVRSLVDSKLPLALALRDLQLSDVAATKAAAAMTAPDAADYMHALRGPGWSAASHCTSDDGQHGASATVPRSGTAESVVPLTGGTDTMPHAIHTASPTPKKSAPKRRKFSARQARLAVAAARQARAERIASFPEEMRHHILNVYSPRSPLDGEWDHLKSAVVDTLAASAVRGDDSMRKFVTHLGYFFAWARQAELPLGPETLTRANVARYDNESLVHGARSTRQTRRSRLAQMADQIHPEQAPIVGPPMEHRKVAAPYTVREMATIRRVARVQPTPELSRQVCLLVGLGAGAGIDSTDLKRLHGRDVIDHGPETGIEVQVTNLRRSKTGAANSNRRIVWVLREYEDLVRSGIDGVAKDRLLLGRDSERANVAAAVFARASFGTDVPALSQSRLRSTWLTTHLGRPTPLNTLLTAAGLSTARSLIDLIEHVPAAGPAQSMR